MALFRAGARHVLAGLRAAQAHGQYLAAPQAIQGQASPHESHGAGVGGDVYLKIRRAFSGRTVGTFL
jgi:hypothetical protein